MSGFFVGQRVRVIWAKNPPGQAFVGREGRIVEVSFGRGEPVIYGLDISRIRREPGVVTGWCPAQLEPIQYDGMQPVEWSECLWMPEGVSV